MKRYSLKKTLLNMFVNSVVLPFVLISVILFGVYYTHILNNYKSNSQIALQSMNNHLESFMENVERFFLQYLFDERIAEFYHYVNSTEVKDDTKAMSVYAVYERQYSVAVANYRIINTGVYGGVGFIPERCNDHACFYLEGDWDNQSTSMGYKSLDIYEDERMSDYSWYQSMKNLKVGDILFIQGSPMDGFTEHIQSGNKITMFKRCNYVETYRTQGYIFVEISENKFANLFKDFSIPEGAGIIVYTPEKEIAYATDKRMESSKEVQNLQTEMYGEHITIDGNGYYVFNTEVEEYGFIISYLLPQKIIFNQVLGTTLIITTVWFTFIIMAFILYTKLSKRVSVSGSKIIQYIDHYRMGNESENRQMLSDMSVEEFDDISKALLEMTDRISGLVQTEYIAKLNQQMAEYKAIQAEINPHFFYNVMNVFQALNRTEDRKKLDKGIVHLSRMFRYTCEHGYESSIAQECRFIESYLTLEKLRFEERINYNIYIEEGLHDFPIPKLLFQPIIENAMCHGMPDNGTSMEIRVNVCTLESKKEQRFVWIAIANDGIPYTENVHTKPGVGIVSVKERLYITYPNSLFWYSREEQFQTICNMMIPVDISEEKE